MLSVVVGASRGIGLGLARHLADQGEQVVATVRAPTGALSHPRIETVVLDVLDDASIAQFAAAMAGRSIDRLILNAGVLGPEEPQASAPLAQWQQVLMTNTAAPIRIASLLIAAVARSHRRQIVMVSSDNASLSLCEGDKVIYRASKAGLNCGMRALSLSPEAAGVTLFAIHPGWVQTDMGGPRARITVAQSVSGMMTVLDREPAPPSGSYWNYLGEAMPW
ncbi:MAG: SDR family NAD(P)-dependent oxidoreductase [Alphaproteobacteria bacterium]|nr:MAG: SDR family NAD(P)-dependent oxidoreductase [Alphaproteobacteria bacterium]